MTTQHTSRSERDELIHELTQQANCDLFIPESDRLLMLKAAALLAATPVREWAGLMDEEIHDAYDEVARREPYSMAVTRRNIARAIESKLREKNAALLAGDKPVDMVLYCPKCGKQHIDAPDLDHDPHYEGALIWENPPHKSHLCHGCGHIWRPSDTPTNGVARTASGKDADTSPLLAEDKAGGEAVGEVRRVWMASYGCPWHEIYWYDKDVDVPQGTKLYTHPQPARTAEPLTEGHALVPVIPTEAQWGGLARDIMMWMDVHQDHHKTPRNLFAHLKRLGREVPQWLRDECEMKNLDHVPSKGTRAVIIYRAMIEDAKIQP